MVVLVIIGVLAAVSAPSFTRDSTARKGRDFANIVAQGMQRAHLDAMNLRATHLVRLCTNSMTIFNLAVSATVPVRSFTAPAGVAIWDATTTSPTTPAPTARGLGDDGSTNCRLIYFNSMGNAGTSASAANLASWNVYVRNENLTPNHPDGGFYISVTGLTAFVNTRNLTFSQ